VGGGESVAGSRRDRDRIDTSEVMGTRRIGKGRGTPTREETPVILTYLLLTAVVLVVAVGAVMVARRAASGHGLEEELQRAAERERPARLLVD